MPRRGAVALVTTILAVVLLLSFKTGDQPTLGHGGLPTDALIGAPPAATAAVAPKRKRRSAAQRKAQAERMKAYWAAKRKKAKG